MSDKAVFPISKTKKRETFTLQEEMKIQEPEVVKILSRKGIQKILALLIENEQTIIDLHNKLNMNPGTIKRHLVKLLSKDLIVQHRIETNIYGIKLKYYRAKAKKIVINLVYTKETLEGDKNGQQK